MAQQNMTAVEWLIDQLRQLAHNPSTHLGMGDIRVTQGMLDDLEEQAKQMEEQAKQMKKEQIMEAYMKAKLENIDTLGLNVVKNKIINDTEQYYKESYGKE